MLALYRKYRPQTFRDVVGQELVVTPLLKSVETGRLSHAYLFSGPRGSGKTSMAKIFAKAINCLNPIHGDACNECANCKLISQNKAIDVKEIDGASNNGVEEVRTIIEQLRFFPAVLKNRIYIIDEAQMLSNAAWNAFLKTLEEPAKDVVFIFTTTEPNKVPITVMSRCQRFQFNRLSKDDLSVLLKKVIHEEKIRIGREAADILLNLADGSARDMLSILDQLASFESKQISAHLINSLFGLASQEQKNAFLLAVKEKHLPEATKIIKELTEKGLDGSVFCQEIAKILLDALIWLRSHDASFLQTVSEETVQQLGLSEAQIAAYMPIVVQTDAKIKKYGQSGFYLELMVFEMVEKI